MPSTCSSPEALTAWAEHAANHLATAPLDAAEINAILEAASRASAALIRPAGPVTMYLAGTLLASGQASDVAAACVQAGRLMAGDVEHGGQGLGD